MSCVLQETHNPALGKTLGPRLRALLSGINFHANKAG